MTVLLGTAELLATLATLTMHNLCSQTPSESDGLSCQLFRIIRVLQLRELVVSEVK